LIKDFLASDVFYEFLRLQDPDLMVDHPTRRKNWFSLDTTMRIYSKVLGCYQYNACLNITVAEYLDLDKDHKGILSREDMNNYKVNDVLLSKVFLDRIFELKPAYLTGLDFTTYVEFVLMMESLDTVQGMSALFRYVDLQNAGRIDKVDATILLRSLNECHNPHQEDYASVECRLVEIFEMVIPSNHYYITLADLKKCKIGGLVLAMFVDLHALERYVVSLFCAQLMLILCSRTFTNPFAEWG